ncbi:MAG: bifunctional adenosylcobinamide kinase/adenosylcobinamide-phosphate guanylyltransferase [Thermodesulfovibrionales bacterium]|nr:bifunctional adenosylcobinamide kinase/adenosylcobinamide-phosphate guanylyltransferase [Thermodesulfovibrionales bacterium]
MGNKIIFIIGGARSGKSTYALKDASLNKGQKAYIATAEALDEEMRDRIEKHKDQRGEDWDTYEEPLRIIKVIQEIKGKYTAIVIDCLTLWLSNVIHSGLDIGNEIESLIDTLRVSHHTSRIYIVSNEVGMGIVPKNELARKFRDFAGILNQKVAEVSDEVYLLVAGIPMKIKDKGKT